MFLPTTKTWEWHTGAAVADFSKLEAFYADATNRGTLWTPNALDGTPEDIAVPYLLSIPAVIVDLLREQGQAQTPHEVLQIIDEFLSTDPSADTLDWALLRMWCPGGEPNRNPAKQKQTQPRHHPSYHRR